MNSHSESWDFIVERSDLRNGRIVSNERHEPLADGEVLMAIERFALTANNLTYAISDEGLGFWDLFAAPVGFGRIPVWGHAVVERARHPDVVEGERFFGMFPMSSHWTFSGRRTRLGLRDESALRARVNPVYNQYAIVRDSEVAQLESDVTFRPLFITSFVLDDYLRENEFFGAQSVWLASASSKTALGLAERLSQATPVTGLTSPKNAAFVAGTGLYQQVLHYGRLGDAANTGPCVVVDFSGDSAMLCAVAQALGDRLVRLVRVGNTHWQSESSGIPDALAARSENFFGPSRIQALVAAWGAQAFEQRLNQALERFCRTAARWHSIRHADGAAGLAQAYARLVVGDIEPSRSCIVRPAG